MSSITEKSTSVSILFNRLDFDLENQYTGLDFLWVTGGGAYLRCGIYLLRVDDTLGINEIRGHYLEIMKSKRASTCP